MRLAIRLVVAIFLAGCDPGPLPTPAPHPDLRRIARDSFPTNSDDPLPLDIAIRTNRLDDLQRLLESGANPNLRWGQSGDHFPLQEAVDSAGYRKTHVRDVVALLLTHGADPNAKWCPFESRGGGSGAPCTSARASTALMFAAGAGETEVVELLLNAGADPHPRDWNGISALDVASTEIGFELIARALFPDVATRDQRSLESLRNGPLSNGVDGPLFAAALIDWGWYMVMPPPIPAPTPGRRPVSIDDYERPVQNRIVERLRILLRIGANPDDRISGPGGADETSLGVAVRRGYMRAAAVLLEAGADANGRECIPIDYDRKTYKPIFDAACNRGNGVTPLMSAAKGGKSEIVQLLLEFKADKSLKDWTGRMAVDYGKDPGVRELLSNSAHGLGPWMGLQESPTRDGVNIAGITTSAVQILVFPHESVRHVACT
jgi:ankyrin repeat protein